MYTPAPCHIVSTTRRIPGTEIWTHFQAIVLFDAAQGSSSVARDVSDAVLWHVLGREFRELARMRRGGSKKNQDTATTVMSSRSSHPWTSF